MAVLNFIIQHWHDILVTAALITGVVISIVKFIPKWKNMSNEERIAYVKRLLENLLPIALSLVTDAEAAYGGGTGKLKRAWVIDELYARIPDQFKPYVTEDNLDAIINRALEEAKQLWDNNDAVKKLITSDD